MGVIIPAILPSSRADLDAKLTKVRGICDAVQIDIIDGRFASPACWPYNGGSHELAIMASREEMLPGFGDISFDMDMMVANPEETAGLWITLGAARITLHAESTT